MDSQANAQQKPNQKQGDAYSEVSYDTLKQDIHQLRDDFSKLTQSLLDKQRGQVDRLREEFSSSGRRAVDSAKSVSDKAIKSTQHQIQERPLTTVLAIFLAGLFLGKLLDRSPAE